MAVATAGSCKYHHDWSLAPELLTPGAATIDQFGSVVVSAVSTQDKTFNEAERKLDVFTA